MKLTMRFLFCLTFAALASAQNYAIPPDLSILQPMLDQMSAQRSVSFLTTTAACPAAGPTAAPGGVPSPITNEADLRTAIAAANAGAGGNVICIQAGSTITVNATVLINRSASSGYIYLRTSSNSLPNRRMRVGAANDQGTLGGAPASYMARIQGAATLGGGNGTLSQCIAQPVISFDGNAHRWVMIGIDVTTAKSCAPGELVAVGDATTSPTYASPYVSDIYFDRVMVHGKYSQPINTVVACGLRIRAERVGIQRSSFFDIRDGLNGMHNDDTNAIGVLNSKGDIVIENNYLESAGENFMSGGGGVPGTPTDLIFRGNYLTKNIDIVDNSGAVGSWYRMKNLFEIKYCERCLIEGNIMENFYITPSTCGITQALAFKVVATNQNNPTNSQNIWTRDITVRYNKFNKVAEMFGIGNIADYTNSTSLCTQNNTAAGKGRRAVGTNRVTIRHNLITELGWRSRRAFRATLLEINYPRPIDAPFPNECPANMSPPYMMAHDIIFENNTVGSFGIQGDAQCPPGGSLPPNAPPQHWNSMYLAPSSATDHRQSTADGYHIRNNVMKGNAQWVNSGANISSADYASFILNHRGSVVNNLGPDEQSVPAGSPKIAPRPPNYAPAATWANMFVDAPGGNFTLAAPYSTYMGVATPPDGGSPQVVGVNIATLNACTAGAATNWIGYGDCPADNAPRVSISAACPLCPTPVDPTYGTITVPASSAITLAYTLYGTCTSATKGGNWSPGGTVSTSGSATQTVGASGSYTYSLTCNAGTPPPSASVTVNIAVDLGPGTPVNVSPPNGDIDISRTPLMQWGVASNAQTYELLRDTTTPPTTVVATTTGTQTSYLTTPALTASTTYYWRVKAYANSLSTLGPIWSFTTVAADPPAADTPTYLTPTDTATGVNPALAPLTWNAAANAVTYKVLLDIVNPPLVTVLSTTGATAFSATGLIPGEVYYWQVVARNILGVEAPGAIWSFTTQAVTAGCPSSGC